MNVLFRGFWASTMATSAMTFTLFESFKRLALRERKPLPPAQITRSLTDKLHLTHKTNSEMQQEATMINHFGYGAVCGIAYALLASKVPGNAALKGGLFGLGVWAASYYGLIPALKLQPQGRHMSPQRKLMMIGTHVVWGVSLAIAEDTLKRKGTQMLDARRRS
ncbi:DUF1440 domain-containing protein [Bdellovibrio sp. KM01]|uniref:DUF1440 domain-containing protein n=1 Tax=Bdellovibrio sp. KM01 TaxID=2748865 RepID=UPI0015EA6540|nr:DUF1440 domain-containing protein [Bdellovibrio sp. KM01]QLY25305.1 DUF1440 domain-containing protein [Bdellovibrio sp. KM01]